ncbi:calcium/sodium antiporter [Portibacter marinus]|uniref:calcium/sodium antiporter n=1 Tax=Portibacter marinus TaxID=2898660 RepID=UPI001F47A495|nr:calcium/sodium antiporter [Portibacter marinus]
MDLLVNILIFVVSLAALLKASDFFVEAAERIGLSIGISPFIIGVTIVAFGTSLPELATSMAAVFAGSSEIVIGNVIGSNITNILLVLGLTAIVAKKIVMDFDIMDIEMPLLLASAFFLYFVLADNQVTVMESILFLVALVVFLLNSFGQRVDDVEKPKFQIKDLIILLISGVVVYFGAYYTIFAIERISLQLGVNRDFIALSVLALGTSLPEVVVSIAAARKGKPGIAVGNVLGSNIFNTYAVVGIPSLIGDLVIPESTNDFSLPFMMAITIMFAVGCISKKLSRWEGVMLVIFYVYFIFTLSKDMF